MNEQELYLLLPLHLHDVLWDCFALLYFTLLYSILPVTVVSEETKVRRVIA
jgi:hypothetical protein